MPDMAKPTMFDDIPTKRPHFFFLMVGKKYFALKKCESRLVADRPSPPRQIQIFNRAIWEITRIIHYDMDTYRTTEYCLKRALLLSRSESVETRENRVGEAVGNMIAPDQIPAKSVDRTVLAACAAYALLLVAFWFVARHFAMEVRIHGHMASSFTAFALLLAPYWFFGFGTAEMLQRFLTNRGVRVLIAGLLVVPYLIFSLPRGEFRWVYAVVLFSIPVAMAALFEFLPPGGARPAVGKLCWQDVVALAVVGLPVEFGWIRGSFPHPGLSALPKILLVDSTLYSFLVVRRLEGVGHDFRACVRDVLIGLRECTFFAPIAIVLGVGLGFIVPHGGMPPASSASAALLVTFFFVAIPEELFFRGLLQNLLEPRIGYHSSLFVTAVIFGLSHFNKPLPFNWRYVLLGTIAGVFYGRGWRDRHRLLSSATTHTLVDLIWSLWFR